MTRAGAAASEGTISTSGARKVVSRKHTPVTMEARPVRAPSPTPDADSMKAVLELMEPAPPAIAATESTIMMRSECSGTPSSSSRSPSAPTAYIAPMRSKKAPSTSVKMMRIVEMVPILPKAPNSEKSPMIEKFGCETNESGTCGTVRDHPPGFTTSPLAFVLLPMLPTVSAMTASVVAPRMPTSMAPFTLRAIIAAMPSTPMMKMSTGQPCSVPLGPSWRKPPPAELKPASWRATRQMNSPMPTLMAVFNECGIAANSALRKPEMTSRKMMKPSMTTSPMASGQVMPGNFATE